MRDVGAIAFDIDAGDGVRLREHLAVDDLDDQIGRRDLERRGRRETVIATIAGPARRDPEQRKHELGLHAANLLPSIARGACAFVVGVPRSPNGAGARARA
jgi:hypothetical protein